MTNTNEKNTMTDKIIKNSFTLVAIIQKVIQFGCQYIFRYLITQGIVSN